MESGSATRLRRIAAVTAREWILIAAAQGEGGDMEQAPDKVAALLDAVRTLERVRAKYALIGGIAVGVHAGIPRATLDTDLAVMTTIERSVIVSAMRKSGFQLVGEHEHSANFRHSTGEPVQLAFDPSFDPMIDRAETMDVSGTSVSIVRKEDLIEMKRRAAADPARRRSKALRDQADVALLLGDVPDPDEGW
jgi:hypothetical protein